MSEQDVITHVIRLINSLNFDSRRNPDKKLGIRMRTELFKYLASSNYKAHKKTKKFTYMGFPVILDDTIPETEIKMGEYRTDIFIEEMS